MSLVEKYRGAGSKSIGGCLVDYSNLNVNTSIVLNDQSYDGSLIDRKVILYYPEDTVINSNQVTAYVAFVDQNNQNGIEITPLSKQNIIPEDLQIGLPFPGREELFLFGPLSARQVEDLLSFMYRGDTRDLMDLKHSIARRIDSQNAAPSSPKP